MGLGGWWRVALVGWLIWQGVGVGVLGKERGCPRAPVPFVGGRVPLAVYVHVVGDGSWTVSPSALTDWLDQVNRWVVDTSHFGLLPEHERRVACPLPIELKPLQFVGDAQVPVSWFQYRVTGRSSFSVLEEVTRSSSGGSDPYFARYILNVWVTALDSPLWGGVVDLSEGVQGIVLDYRYLDSVRAFLYLLGEWLGVGMPVVSSCMQTDSLTCAFRRGVCDLGEVLGGGGFPCDTVRNSCLELPDLPDPMHNYMLGFRIGDTCRGYWSVDQVGQALTTIYLRYRDMVGVRWWSVPAPGNVSVQAWWLREDPPALHLLVRYLNVLCDVLDSVEVGWKVVADLDSPENVLAGDTVRLPVFLNSCGVDSVWVVVPLSGLDGLSGWLHVEVHPVGGSDPELADNWLVLYWLGGEPDTVPVGWLVDRGWVWEGLWWSGGDSSLMWYPLMQLVGLDSVWRPAVFYPFFEDVREGWWSDLVFGWVWVPDTVRVVSLSMDVAYARYDPFFTDTLEGWAEFPNGTRILLFKVGGAQLETAGSRQTRFWYPVRPDQWRRLCFVLPYSVIGEVFRLRLRARTGYGNNLFMSRVVIGEGGCSSLVSGVGEVGGGVLAVSFPVCLFTLWGVLVRCFGEREVGLKGGLWWEWLPPGPYILQRGGQWYLGVWTGRVWLWEKQSLETWHVTGGMY